MSGNDNEFLTELKKTLKEKQFKAASVLVDQFLRDVEDTGRCVGIEVARPLMEQLQDFRQFRSMIAIAECLRDHGQSDPTIIRQLAQALIEEHEVTRAIGELDALKPVIERLVSSSAKAADPKNIQRWKKELAEVPGLLGRAYKQLYVDAQPTALEPRLHDWETSVSFYRGAYERDPEKNYWHGVNLIALFTHKERVASGDRARVSPDAAEIARSILGILEDKTPDAWILATRAESLLALGDTPETIKVVRAYLESDDIDAFKIQSTERQFRELWGLTEESPPGKQILPMMRARLLDLGVPIEMSPTDEANAHLEAVFGDTGYQPLEWLRTGLVRARSVARLGRDVHSGVGTGFLLDCDELRTLYPNMTLLLTNAHVCSSDANVRAAANGLAPHETVVAFLGGPKKSLRKVEPIAVKDILFTSPPDKYDATLLWIESAPKWAKPAELSQKKVETGHRVNIIGHPHGGGMTVSLQDNEVVDTAEKRLYYKTPTDPGSSGSPVFDQNWELVGLHHAREDEKQANRGIPIGKIIDAIKKQGARKKKGKGA